jgi:hypothetical protein
MKPMEDDDDDEHRGVGLKRAKAPAAPKAGGKRSKKLSPEEQLLEEFNDLMVKLQSDFLPKIGDPSLKTQSLSAHASALINRKAPLGDAGRFQESAKAGKAAEGTKIAADLHKAVCR